jgi:hypothetical protein
VINIGAVVNLCFILVKDFLAASVNINFFVFLVSSVRGAVSSA